MSQPPICCITLCFLVMGILNDKWMIVDDLESRKDMTEYLFCFLNLSLSSNQELSLKKGPSLLKEMSKVVVKILDPYRKAGVKGHIGNTEDFKHLAKKVSIRINVQNIFILSGFHQFNYTNLR